MRVVLSGAEHALPGFILPVHVIGWTRDLATKHTTFNEDWASPRPKVVLRRPQTSVTVVGYITNVFVLALCVETCSAKPFLSFL